MELIPETIRDAIESICLPPIPHVLLKFLNMVENDHTSMKELATLVEQDPALSARFLTIANSPTLRRQSEIKRIDQCLATLGTRLSRALAACLAIQSVFARLAGEAQYDFTGFWGHSLRVAETARALAAQTNYIDADEAYLAALLHDVGQLILLGGVGERYGDLLRCSIDEAILLEIEGPAIGTDHAIIGAWLIDKWKLSSFMSDAVLFHHKQPDEIMAADPLSQIVWSSHVVSKYSEKTDLVRKEMLDLAAVKSMLGLDVDDVIAIRNQSSERVAMLSAALGITEASDTRTIPFPFGTLNKPQYAHHEDPAYSQLEAMVRNMALMRPLQWDLSGLCSEDEILVAVRESARILFGLQKIAFLMAKPGTRLLSGPRTDGQPALLQRLEISLEPAHSLAASVAVGEKACASFDKDLPFPVSLADIQVARAIESKGLLYVPMRTRERIAGVMVYGLNDAQYARVQRHLSWMTNFAHLAAVSIEACRSMRERENTLETNLASRFEQHARKVVHEAGNPLSIIKNYLKIVSQKLPIDNGVQEELEILREEIDRVTLILKRLGDLSEEPKATGSVDINRVITGMMALYSESLFSSRGIEVEKNLESGLPAITGDRDSIKQILFNLWKNAAEAMPGGGRFVVSTRGNVDRNGQLYTEICLVDSGPGLPDDVMRDIFQPLASDRRPGHAGLGLSIVASLVERLGGLITFQSNKDQGTKFAILLPQFRMAEK